MGNLPRVGALIGALVLLGLAAGTPARAQSASDLERRVKAAFLFKFVGYVEWPEGTFSGDVPATIGVVGDRRLANELAGISAGRTIEGKRVSVVPLDRVDRDTRVHVLFIAGSQSERLESLIDAAPARGVLVVTESHGALGSGSVINFVLHRGRVRFDISLAAAAGRGLILRSGLLAVAQSVIPGGQ